MNVPEIFIIDEGNDAIDTFTKFTEQFPTKLLKSGYYKYKTNSYILAGPSCDGHDILYEKFLYELPQNLKIGDRVRIFSAGAYTTAYQSNFNGIKRIKETFIE